ncbi:hypothetical protein [Actinomadura rupiterrae]|uniref:hypothetical protein n=1 Tax=Actinomadura rupiterrae TaxID=559627 RepID=UPI0020A2A9F6|nr:hypothetical protein [Actinomadura rupiterrae]MCP2337397.1 hypothetical protein [Actinomadura rupiterrae]
MPAKTRVAVEKALKTFKRRPQEMSPKAAKPAEHARRLSAGMRPYPRTLAEEGSGPGQQAQRVAELPPSASPRLGQIPQFPGEFLGISNPLTHRQQPGRRRRRGVRQTRHPHGPA